MSCEPSDTLLPFAHFPARGKFICRRLPGASPRRWRNILKKSAFARGSCTGPPPAPFDFPLNAPNLELIAQPFWSTTAESLLHFFGIARAYMRTCRRADVLFVRGMCPYIALLYLCALAFRKPICHWIVGDPVALLRTSDAEEGPCWTPSRLLYALQDRLFTRLGRWLTNGALICNGRELARAYASPRTVEIVSSTIRESEFFPRIDTCQGPVVRILFVGFIRPEKGIEYLLDAVSQLKADVPWELEIVGPREFPEYSEKLDRIAAARGHSRPRSLERLRAERRALVRSHARRRSFRAPDAFRGNAACSGRSSRQWLALHFHHGRRRADNGHGRIRRAAGSAQRCARLWRRRSNA